MILSDQFFKAVLKTEDDQYLSEGYARVSLRDKAVEFKSQFVPILFLGTTVKIYRMVGDNETHCFVGTVYLSSQELLRIVDVNDTLLAQVELETLQEISVQATVTSLAAPMQKRRFWKRIPIKNHPWEAKVFSISLNKLRFISSARFQVGEQLHITTQPPLPLKKATIEITQILLFGEEKNGYRCNIVSMGEPAKAELIEFLSQNTQIFLSDDSRELEEEELLSSRFSGLEQAEGR